jgi:hypothetical protein
MNEMWGVLKWFPMFGGTPLEVYVDPKTEASTHFCHVDLVDRSSSAKSLVKVQAPVLEGRGSIWQIEPEATIHWWFGVPRFMILRESQRPTPNHDALENWLISGQNMSTYYEARKHPDVLGRAGHTQILRQC